MFVFLKKIYRASKQISIKLGKILKKELKFVQIKCQVLFKGEIITKIE
jgi:short-subunit dehydrogenase